MSELDDVTDEVEALMRSRPSADGESVADVVARLGVNFDDIQTMWYQTSDGSIQVVCWPMNYHIHTQECGRA